MRQRTLLRTALMTVLLASTAVTGYAQDTTIQQLAQRWVQAYNTHNRAAIGALYTEGAHLMTHGEPTVVGRKNIEAFWAEDFQQKNPLTVLTVTHSFTGVDMALVHGNYQVIARESGAVLGSGRFAHIWTKTEDGRWLLDRDLWLERFEPYVP